MKGALAYAASVVLIGVGSVCEAAPPPTGSAAPRTVLAVFAGPEDHPSNLALDAAMREALAAPPELRIDYFAEYLETDGFDPDAASLRLRDYIAQKYQARHIDAVIALTDVALWFVLTNRDQLFPGAPIVYEGLSVPEELLRRADRPVTGVLVGVAYAETLKVALALHPGTSQVFVVAKSGDPSRIEAVRRELAGFSAPVQLTFITEQTVPQLLHAVKAVPSGSLILYIWHQPEDASNFIYPDTIAQLVAETASVPVYGTSDFYTGLGVVGGVVRLTRETGTRLGQMTRQVLDGVKPQDIPIERARLVPIFDWRQLRRWGIDESRLSSGSDVRFRTPTTWEAYRAYIIGTIVVVGAQLVLIASLLAQRKRRRHAEETIRAREATLRTSYEQIRQLAGRLISAEEAARAGIARDLHDDVCQQLAFVSIAVGTLKNSSGRIQDSLAQQAFAELEQRTQGMFDGIRRLSHELHPATLRLLGIAPALKAYCREVSTRHGVRITFTADGDLVHLAPDASVCLFRIAQESLRNGILHGGARHFIVSLCRVDARVDLTVSDDGRGFDLDAVRRDGQGLGLVSMEERAHLVGGMVQITTAPSHGTTVRVHCPADVSAAASLVAS